jgi:hypothetical protein
VSGDLYDRRDDTARIETTDEVKAQHAGHTDIGYEAVELHATIDCIEKVLGRPEA